MTCVVCNKTYNGTNAYSAQCCSAKCWAVINPKRVVGDIIDYRTAYEDAVRRFVNYKEYVERIIEDNIISDKEKVETLKQFKEFLK